MGYGGMPRPAAARPLLGYGGMLSPGARRYHVILPRHRHPTANPARGGTQIDLIIDQIGAYAPSNRKIRAARPRVGQHVHPRPPDDPPTWTTVTGLQDRYRRLRPLLTVTGRRGMGVCLGRRPPGRSWGMGVCSGAMRGVRSYPYPPVTEILCRDARIPPAL